METLSSSKKKRDKDVSIYSDAACMCLPCTVSAHFPLLISYHGSVIQAAAFFCCDKDVGAVVVESGEGR